MPSGACWGRLLQHQLSRPDVKAILQDVQFFAELFQLNKVLEPISEVIMAVQSQQTTLADVAR